MKPRAPESAIRGPKSEPSRLEASTIALHAVRLPATGADLEAVDVRQADVEQDDVGDEPEHLGDAGLAVVRVPTTTNPSVSSSRRAVARKDG